jgi:hypothetical protein
MSGRDGGRTERQMADHPCCPAKPGIPARGRGAKEGCGNCPWAAAVGLIQRELDWDHQHDRIPSQFGRRRRQG